MTFTEVIAHPTAPLGYLAKVLPSGVDKKTVHGEQPVRLCNYTDIYYHDRITSDMAFMEATATESEVARFTLRPGDVVITKDSETADDIAIPGLVTEDLGGVVLGYHNALIRPDTSKLDPRFLFWALMGRQSAGYFETKARGVTRVGLRADDMAALPVPVPPLQVQRRVADMLDAETARIDTLIAKNQHVIGTLLRRDVALAAEVVTHRAAGSSTSRHSSSFWIGQVPSDWAVLPLGLRYRVQLGKMLNADRREKGDQRPYLANVDVQWDRINTTSLRTMDFSADEWGRYGVEPGDVLICEGGDIGRAAVWPEDGPSGIHYQKALHRARPANPESENSRWLYYCLFVAAKTGVFQFGAESSTIDHLTGERLWEHRFPFPPRKEQDRLVARLDAAFEDSARLRQKVQQQSTLFKTRRQALITAVVTGQITV